MRLKLSLPALIFGVILILGFLSDDVSPLTPKCKCKFLVPRTFLQFRDCGLCAKCYWNLYYFADNFESKMNKTAKTALNSSKEYFQAFKTCAERLPNQPTFLPDELCREMSDECSKHTDEVFEDQCVKLYNTDSPTSLIRQPPAIDLLSYETHLKRGGMNESSGLFNGSSNPAFYVHYCPMLNRRYEFTWYLLFDGAAKQYGIPKSTDYQRLGPWNEELALPEIGSYMKQSHLEAGVKQVRKIFTDFGYEWPTENNLGNVNPRRFCGHPDIFVCVEKQEGPIDNKPNTTTTTTTTESSTSESTTVPPGG